MSPAEAAEVLQGYIVPAAFLAAIIAFSAGAYLAANLGRPR